MSKIIDFDINDKRSYIFLVPIGKEKSFISAIKDDSSPKEERIKVIYSKLNGTFRIYFLRLPEVNFEEVEQKLYELQNEFLQL